MLYFRIAVVALDALLGAGMLYVLYTATTRAVPLEKWWARAGDILIMLAGAVMVGSGSLKVAHVPIVVTEMTSLGLPGWKLELVAALELLSGLLFLTPRLRSIGLPFASSYLGAAICAHIQAGQYFAVLPTMVILGCCWLGAALRHPQLLWSLAPKAASP